MYEMAALRPAFKAFVSSENAFTRCLCVIETCCLIKLSNDFVYALLVPGLTLVSGFTIMQ